MIARSTSVSAHTKEDRETKGGDEVLENEDACVSYDNENSENEESNGEESVNDESLDEVIVEDEEFVDVEKPVVSVKQGKSCRLKTR